MYIANDKSKHTLDYLPLSGSGAGIAIDKDQLAHNKDSYTLEVIF